jgi:hypothetical protein
VTRITALCLAGLLTLPAMAGESVPSSSVVGGLRRGPSLGIAFASPQASAAVTTVFPGSTAEKMGIKAGDVIVSIDGEAIADAAPFGRHCPVMRAIRRVIARRGEETVTMEGRWGAPLEQQADYAIECGSVAVGGHQAARHRHAAQGRGKAPGGAADRRPRRHCLMAAAAGRAARPLRQAVDA